MRCRRNALLVLGWVLYLPVVALAEGNDAKAAAMSGHATTIWPGAHLIISVSGTALNGSTAKLIKEIRPAGVILQTENILDADQTLKLVQDIKKAAGPGQDEIADLPLIAVDQEGGRVNRLRLKDSPHAADLGAIRDLKEAREKARTLGRLYAEECRKRGIAILLGPVLDISAPGATDAIGDRSFGTDAAKVTAMGLAFARGVMEGGVVPVVKHFPGHGSTRENSHEKLAILTQRGDDLRQTLYPFQEAVRQHIPAVMVGHIACPALDKSNTPASLSRGLVGSLLRDTWGYDGFVVTDDIRMGAIADRDNATATEKALAAGNDAVILCNPDLGNIRLICRQIQDAAEHHRLDVSALEKTRGRIERLQEWLRMSYFLGYPQRPPETTANAVCLADLPLPVLEPDDLEPLVVKPDSTAENATNRRNKAQERKKTEPDQEPIAPKPPTEEASTVEAQPIPTLSNKSVLTPHPAPDPTQQVPDAPPSKKQTATAKTKTPSEPPAYSYIKVMRGDTIHGLAQQFHVSEQAILDANNLKNARKLHEGKTLKIPR